MSHNDGLKLILKIITNIKLIGCFYTNYSYNFKKSEMILQKSLSKKRV